MFVSGVNDTGDTAEQLTVGVKMTLVINIHLQISPHMFETIQNDPNGILGGRGDPDS
jgi:hypothetical protein